MNNTVSHKFPYSRAHIFSSIDELHLEVTRKCNLKCTYCYSSENSLNAPLMSESIAIKAAERVFEHSKCSKIAINFHGGEPLLAPVEWIDSVSHSIEGLSKIYDKKAIFRMQSNATLVNEKIILTLKQYNIQVGVSIDGPPEINFLSRGDRFLSFKGAKLLESVGLLGGIIITLNENNSKYFEDVLDYLAKNNLPIITFIITRNLGRAVNLDWHLTASDIINARTLLLNRILYSKIGPIDVTTLQMVKRFLHPPTYQDYTKLACSQPFCHAGLKTIIADAYGRIYACGLASNIEKGFLGHIETLDEVFYYEALEKFHLKSEKYYKICSKCEASVICNFGCTIEGEISDAECLSVRELNKILSSIPKTILEDGYFNAKNLLTSWGRSNLPNN